MRAFIALTLPDRFRHQVGHLKERLARDVEGRFVSNAVLHVTLAFLNEINEAEAAAAVESIEMISQEFEPVPLCAEGLGTFGSGKERTLYLALSRERRLMDLASMTRLYVAEHGLDFNHMCFTPHITLARRARIPSVDFGRLALPSPAKANRVILYKSTLTPKGPLYKELYTVELRGSGENIPPRRF